MTSGVGSKADDLKTCLSLKSTAFLHVGPESGKVSDAVKPIRMASYRAEIHLLQQPQTLALVRHHDRYVHVSRKNIGSCLDLQLTVVGNRGAAQLQKTVYADLVAAAENSTVIGSHLCVTYLRPPNYELG